MDKRRYEPREKKTAIKNSVGRILLAVLLLLIQFFWVWVLVTKLTEQYPVINIVISVFAVILVIAINENEKIMSLKAPTMILIMLAPVIGVLFFLLSEAMSNTIMMKRRFENNRLLTDSYIVPDRDVISSVPVPTYARDLTYIQEHCRYPVYKDNEVTYYADTTVALKSQIEEISKAQSFIFMEYHAIEDQKSFEGLKSALFERAAAGVEVRILYDDLGSFVFINHDFIKRMEAHGIKCRAFNPIMPFFNLFINNRDHRKITIIDGKVGFTGGYNIADEYFNITHPYGEWKDAGIMIRGSSVRSFTAMFLEMWNSISKKDVDESVERFFPDSGSDIRAQGYIAPFADSPLDDEPAGENVYINVINSAVDYVWFITPYLIISDELKRALQIAAKRGVDVRIVTPGKPDKKMIYQATRSYYSELISSGVKIYEFTPGFCHAKLCVADDALAVVGTINLDFRSLYHHFENAVLMYDVPAIADIKKDFEDTMARSSDVTSRYNVRQKGIIRVVQSLLRLVAPLF